MGLVPVQALCGVGVCLLSAAIVSKCRVWYGQCMTKAYIKAPGRRCACLQGAGKAKRRRQRDKSQDRYCRGTFRGIGRTYLLWPSTGLAACLRAPSSALPAALGLSCCLGAAGAPFPAASPFAVAVDMAARGGGVDGVRSAGGGAQGEVGRAEGARRSAVDGCAHSWS